MKLKWFGALILAFNFQALGYEVDQFTRRDDRPKDSTELLDVEIQRRLSTAIADSNKGFLRFKCNGDDEAKKESRTTLFKALRSQLVSTTEMMNILAPGSILPVSKMETFIDKNSKIDKRKIPLSESIYRGASKYSNLLKMFGSAPVITINGIQIGSDKLGHLFDQGYIEYLGNYRSSTESKKYREGLLHSIESEKNEYGAKTTGVFSFGDISANYAGQRFWESICGYPNQDTSDADRENIKTYRCKKDAYVFCDPKSGNWTLNPNRKFTLKDYVTPAWDESINCSLYEEKAVASITEELSRRAHFYKGNPSQPCPAEPQKCVDMQSSYPREIAALLTSPLCKKIIDAKKKNEPMNSKEKFNCQIETYFLEKPEVRPDSKKKGTRTSTFKN